MTATLSLVVRFIHVPRQVHPLRSAARWPKGHIDLDYLAPALLVIKLGSSFARHIKFVFSYLKPKSGEE